MTVEEINIRLDQLREMFKNAKTEVDRKNLTVRGILLKKALAQKEPTPKLI